MKRIALILALISLITAVSAGCKKAESSANGDTPMPGYVMLEK